MYAMIWLFMYFIPVKLHTCLNMLYLVIIAARWAFFALPWQQNEA